MVGQQTMSGQKIIGFVQSNTYMALQIVSPIQN